MISFIGFVAVFAHRVNVLFHFFPAVGGLSAAFALIPRRADSHHIGWHVYSLAFTGDTFGLDPLGFSHVLEIISSIGQLHLLQIELLAARTFVIIRPYLLEWHDSSSAC